MFSNCRVTWGASSCQPLSDNCGFTTVASKCLDLGRGLGWSCGLDSSSVSLSSRFMLLIDTGTFDSGVSRKLPPTGTFSSPTRAMDKFGIYKNVSFCFLLLCTLLWT